MDSKKQMMLHSNAINLARRLSVQNENDLLQENFFEEAFDEPALMKKEPVTPTYTKDVCQKVASSMVRVTQLPMECNQYPEVVREVKRKGSDATPGASFLG